MVVASSRPRRAIPLRRILGWAAASLAAAILGAACLWTATRIALEPLVEGLPVATTWLSGVYLGIAGIVGGAICLGHANRVATPPGGRSLAYAWSGAALGVSAVVVAVGVLSPFV